MQTCVTHRRPTLFCSLPKHENDVFGSRAKRENKKKSSKKQHFEPQIRLIELNTHTQHMHAQKPRVDFSHRQAMAASQTCIMYHLIAIFGYISLSPHLFCFLLLALDVDVVGFQWFVSFGDFTALGTTYYTCQRCLSLTADSLADMMRKLLRTGLCSMQSSYRLRTLYTSLQCLTDQWEIEYEYSREQQLLHTLLGSTVSKWLI